MIRKLVCILMICAGLLAMAAAGAEAAPTQLTLSESEISLAVGKIVTLKATVVNPPAGKKGKAAWESSDPEVCTVSASGAVKATAEGQCVITCTMELPEGETLTAECRVNTFVMAKQLKAVQNSIRLNVGETVQAEYSLMPEETTEKSLAWSSENEGIATVDAEGRITAAGPGTAKVTAETKDGSKKKAVFTVYVPTLHAAETEYTIRGLTGLDIPIEYYGDDYEKDVIVKSSGRAVAWTAQREGTRIGLHLDGLEAGDSKVIISDRKDGKAKITLGIHTEEEALRNNMLVEFTGFKFHWQNGDIHISVNAINHTPRKITRVDYAVDYRDADGGQIFFSYTPEGADIPVASATSWRGTNWKFSPYAGRQIKAYLVNNDNYFYTDTLKEIRAAVTGLFFDDGTSLIIPDGQRYWFSSLTGYMEKPEVKANYTTPEQEIVDKAGSFELGWNTYAVTHSTMSWYEVTDTGLYVTHVEPGSIAEKYGLQVKDLVYEADGIRYADDPYIIQRAKAKMADGEAVIFKVLRSGESLELKLALDEEDLQKIAEAGKEE